MGAKDKIIKSAFEAVTDSPAFRRWFGASKVVDEAGKPLIVYHGTPGPEFDAFDPSKKGVTSVLGMPFETHRQGFYFAEKPGFAHGFAQQDRGRKQGSVIDAFLSIKNPLDVSASDNESYKRLLEVARRMHDEDKAFDVNYIADRSGHDGFWELLDTENGGDALVRSSRDLGYDGIKMIEPDMKTFDPSYIPDDYGAKTWVAFDPTQIKSTKNVGTFNPTDPRIHKAGGGLIRKLLGEVAKEAPQLTRGAASAERRAMVNIGLDVPGGGRLTPEEAAAVLERVGARPIRMTVAQSDTEPTLIAELERALTPEEAHDVSVALRQEAIAQVDETGRGELYGPMADNWRPFNGDYFIHPSGKRLTQAIMEAGNPQAVPGGVEPDPVLERLDEIARRLQPEPEGYAGGGAVKKGAVKAVEWLEQFIKKDNPADRGPSGMQWLLDKQANSGPKGLSGADTAYTRQPVDIPVELLAKMKGAKDEVRGPGDPKFDALMKAVQEEGWKPDPISVAINHRGEPYIYEGNTRTAVAKALGIDSVPGDIHWMNGGEMIGNFTPQRIAEFIEKRSQPKPLRLYHGRAYNEPIQQLDPFISTNQLGIHLGDAATASRFAPIRPDVRVKDAGGRVIPLDVDIKNPLRLPDDEGDWRPANVYRKLTRMGLLDFDPETNKRLTMMQDGLIEDVDGSWIDAGDESAALDAMLEIQDIIRGLGHDGVVYTNRYEIPDEAAFERAKKRSRFELNSLSDDEFKKEFPEATDSYIAFRNEQLKSPFGEGPGVGYAGGGVVRKLGAGLVDLLDFGGVANKEIRDNVVRGTELRGDGRKFKDFFADVTSGKSDKYKPSGLDNYEPAIDLGDDARAFRMLRDHYSGNFDNHIKTSIPGFDEVQNAVGSSLLKTYGRDGADILDIGSSEGALIKALSDASEGRIRTTGVDPNPDMLRTYNTKPQADGSRSVLAAFGGADDAGKVAWEEADGTPIPFFDPQGQQYDAAHEAMVFQFISNARKAQAERVKQLLKPKGVAIFEEKFGNPKSIFDANEAKKDLYKSRYYTPEQMEIKRKEVLNTGNDAVEGMTDLQVSQAEMEAILRDTFRNRAQFWDSGNFKGYAASDDNRALEDFLNNLQSLDSQYATTKTPRGFADGGPVWSEEDRASMSHEDSYGTGRRPAFLETMGTKIPLGETNYYIRPDGTEYAPGEEGPQFMHDAARMGVYAVPGVGPWIGASLDTTEALANDDPLSAGMAVAFGPGGKYAKAALTGALAYGMDPAEAEAGVFGRLGKWGASPEGQKALNRAIKMSSEGAHSTDIISKTGWFKDLDGHWKYYRPSAGGSLKPNGGGTLGEVLDDPYLYEEYPDLFNMIYRRKNKEGAHYDPELKEIVLGDTSKPGYNTLDAGGPYGAVLHEVYHAKADLEGWPQGTNRDGAQEKIARDMTRFLNNRRGSPEFNTGQDLFQRSQPSSGLYHGRYEAEIGEALARREAAIREVGPDLMQVSTPADQPYIDLPIGNLFHPGEVASPEKYRALLQYLDDQKVAADMQAAAKPTPKKRRP